MVKYKWYKVKKIMAKQSPILEIVLSILVLFIGQAMPVLAVYDSQLQQVITGVDCTLTGTSNSNGTVVNPSCSPQNPTITSAQPNGGQPTISGLFDAAYGGSLQITVGGVTYTRTVSPELSTNGNVWTLNLNGLQPPLTPGTYDVVITHTTTGNVVLHDTSSNELVIPPYAVSNPTVNPTTSTDGKPIITGTYDPTHAQSLTVAVAGVTYTLGTSPQLTASGNTWELDLSGLASPLPNGAYDVQVTLTTTDGQTKTDTTTNELVVQPPYVGNAPTVNPITWMGAQPIITGTYDAANTAQLRVFFNGRWYVLGVDPELTVSGNNWTLDLRNLQPPLAEGTYEVVVQVTMNDGRTLGDTSTVEIKVIPPTIGNVITHPVAAIRTFLADTGMSLWHLILIALSLIAVGFMIMYFSNRKLRLKLDKVFAKI